MNYKRLAKLTTICMLAVLLVQSKVLAFSSTEFNQGLQVKLQPYNVIEYNKNINTIKPYSFVSDGTQGLTDFYNKIMIIHQSDSLILNNHIYRHESGHVLDTVYLSSKPNYHYYSDSDQFKKIYEIEKHSIDSYTLEKYVSVDIHEYFAECFAMYLECPEKLKQSSPYTYEFINYIYLNDQNTNIPIIIQNFNNYISLV